MKKFVKVVMSGALVAAMGCTMAAIAGCGGNETGDGGDGSLNIEKVELSIGGSTSVQPLMEDLAGAFEEFFGDYVTITVEGGGSGAGVTGAIDGTFDIGMASRELKDEEASQIDYKSIALDGIALVVNPNCTVTDVTTAQVKALYENKTPIGSITTAYCREDGSGTRSAFEEIVGIENCSQDWNFSNSTGGVVTAIKGNSSGNTVGYISLGSLTSDIKALTYNGVEATVENIKNNTYKLARPFNIMYNEDELSDVAKIFIDFIMSSAGQSIVASHGYITMD